MYSDDELLWLEEIESDDAIKWVKDQNKLTHDKYTSTSQYSSLLQDADKILNSEDRIPYVRFHGNYVYNLWKDKANPKGLYRRTTFENYQTSDPKWETVLSLDELSKAENEDWVWAGMTPLSSTSPLTLIMLSRGGKDAKVVREFNLEVKQFVDNGFIIEESKTTVTWLNENTLTIGTTLESMPVTESGYPAQISIWNRGTSVKSATPIYECSKRDMGIWIYSVEDNGISNIIIDERKTFYTGKISRLINGKPEGTIIPDHGEILDIFKEKLIISIRKNWNINGKSYIAGSILSIDENDNISEVQIPTDVNFPSDVSSTKDFLYIHSNNNVSSILKCFELENNVWKQSIVNLPENGSIHMLTKDKTSNRMFILYYDFLTPDSLYIANGTETKRIKTISNQFNSSQYSIEQHYALSKDGTKVPYYQVARKDLRLTGNNPTLQYGYGGFEVSLTPSYSGTRGKLWLDQGGVYILSNIRGGGEFGPKWHQAALKENRQKAYDDFIAISEDLIKRKVTSPDHLGIAGGSNGGLLMGAILTQRPELYGAVVCQVPLLDMKRYHLLLAGASWMGEYGNPDKPDEWEYISKYSPLQNVFKEKQYPPIFFMTSTKDDRVHPGHARKMAKKMKDLGHNVEYFENINGGHGGVTTQSDRAHWDAIQYTFLLEKLTKK